jgi:2-dehydropantoate 2-reductase
MHTQFYLIFIHSPSFQPSHNIHVSLVCRSNYSTIAKSGVILETRNFGRYTFHPHSVYSSIEHATNSVNAPSDGWDYVVVTTKALPDIVDDSATIAPVVRDSKTCIVLTQNGFGVEAPHRARFPRNPIISGVTVISAELISPGTVRQNRWTRVSLGPYSDGIGNSRKAQELSQRGAKCVDELVRIFTDHGKLRDAEAYDEVGLQTVRWHKICINAAFNPSAILAGGMGNADMVLDTELRSHVKGCMEEVFAAAPAVLGRTLPDKLAKPDQIIASTERNKGSKPSMLLDWESGKPLELEVILGNPVRIARERGYEMSRLQTLYALLRSAQNRRNEEKAKGKPMSGSKL